ncbi:MAG TPA: hypothetical protein VEA59_03480, partial [Patescibacteria group bacterium]|nr:hypothetical protein [Patescibacteria group bacterium]
FLAICIFFYIVFSLTIALKLSFGVVFPDLWTLLACLVLIEGGFFNTVSLLLICGLLADFASGLPAGGMMLGYLLGGAVVWVFESKIYIFRDSSFYVNFLVALFFVTAYTCAYVVTVIWGYESIGHLSPALFVGPGISVIIAKPLLKLSAPLYAFFKILRR